MKQRLLIVLSYLGLGPLFWLMLRKRHDNPVHIHARNSIVLFGILLGIVLLYGISWLIEDIMVIREIPYKAWYFRGIEKVTWGLVFIWLTVWFLSLLGAVLSENDFILPGLRGLNSNRRFCWISLWSYFATLGLLIWIVYLYYMNPEYVSYENQQSAAYVLYDDMYDIDQQLIGIPFYWLAREVKAKWGDKLVILPIQDETVKLALNNAIIVVVWTHGSDGKIWLYSSKRWLPPEYFRKYHKPRLKFIYLSACQLAKGKYENLWHEAFGGARVQMFSRLSAEIEHVLWNLFEGPTIVRNL
jgi:hypothetical protein